MKILSVLHFPEFGGPHNQLLRLSSLLAGKGVEYVAVLPEGPGAERLRAGGVSVEILEPSRVRAVMDPRVHARMLWRFSPDVWRLVRLFRRYKPDVVQLNGLMNPHAAIAARLLGIPVVWQLLDTRPPLPVRKVLMWPVRWLADSLMPIGGKVAEAHPGAAVFKDRMVVFYPPVDTRLFHPDVPGVRALRDELSIPRGAPIVGVVGNINPQKGHEYFIDAAALVHRAIPQARFIIAGHIYPNHARYYESLLNRAKDRGLAPGEHVYFLGSRQDIPEILASIDVLALASVPLSEGTPTVILEAMACGVPVVASDVGSVSEVVADGETGYVVPSMQPERMAERIAELLSSIERREEFGHRARQRVEREFSLEACVDAHIHAFSLAIAHRKRSSDG